MKAMIVTLALLLGAGGMMSLLAATGSSTTMTSAEGIRAITKPSDDRTLSFVRPGRVVEIPVKEGDTVKPGQLLARLDDSEEAGLLKIDELKAASEVQVKAQKLLWEQSKLDYARLQDAKERHGASLYEVEHARVDMDINEARIDVATEQQKVDRLTYEKDKVAFAKLRLLAPDDEDSKGRTWGVEKVFLKVGESADIQSMKAIRIVQINPLWVELPVPRQQAIVLRPGDVAHVRFADKTRDGKVLRVPLVGEGAIESITVRLEVPNELNLPAGEQVYVTFGGAGMAVGR